MSENRETVEQNAAIEPESSSPITRWMVIGLAALGGGIVVIFLVALVGGLTGSEGVASAFRILRDFFIIVLALQGILISVALIVLVVQLSALINLLKNEVSPLVSEARRTLTTVRGTTEFVSKNVATPVIRVASTVAAVSAFWKELSSIRRITGTRRK